MTTPSDLDAFAHDHVFLGAGHDDNARRTMWVVVLTAVTMLGEIAACSASAPLAQIWGCG